MALKGNRLSVRHNYSLFRNDRSSIFSNGVFGIDIGVIHTGNSP